jgi:hypothetical protein
VSASPSCRATTGSTSRRWAARASRSRRTIAPERKELAKRFIAWFLQRPVQEKWITKPAGFTANTEILALARPSARRTPYNGPFADSIDSDARLLERAGVQRAPQCDAEAPRRALDGECSSKEALDALAQEKERILKEAGLL